MTHLEILKKAFDEIGILYIVITDGEWSNLFLVGDDEHKSGQVDKSRLKQVFEFENGEWASY